MFLIANPDLKVWIIICFGSLIPFFIIILHIIKYSYLYYTFSNIHSNMLLLCGSYNQ